MKKENGILYIVILILVAMVRGLSVFLYCNKKEEKNLNLEYDNSKQKVNNIVDFSDNSGLMIDSGNNYSKEKNLDFNSVSGIYKYSKNVDEDNGIYCELILYKNGMFKYECGEMFAVGVIGNYIIDGNEIVLNKLFETGSDISLTVTEGETRLIINEDGSINNKKEILNEVEFFYNDIENVQLKKLSGNEEKDALKDIPSINEIFNYSIFSNESDLER